MKYYRPDTLTQYFDYVSALDLSQAVILAGGTDLIPKYERGMTLPDHLIDIKAIEELQGITDQEEAIEIGSLTTIESLKQDDIIRCQFPALALAADAFAGVQIRHRATLGGNIVNASPAGDTLPPLYAYKATARITGPEGERHVPLADFIQGPGRVSLNPGELLQAIMIPKTTKRSFFYKLGLRRAMAIAVANFAVVYATKDHHFSDLTIAAGAVAPQVVYLNSLADAMIRDGLPQQEALDLIEQDIAPIDDIRGSAAYRRRALKNLLGYYLDRLLEQSHGG
ncbi:MAG: xanthine dehydrogenase family protein subunit M [Candidatus Neomarinimicrobiota bacterium]